MNEFDPLVALIRKMTPSEKRYFKTHFNNHTKGGKSDFVELFDSLNGAKSVDEVDLRWTPATGLYAKKKQLYEKLLRSLSAYNENNSAQIEFYKFISEVVLLEKKGLNNQALKRLKKAEKFTKKYSLNFDEVKINYIKRRLVRNIDEKNILRDLISLQNDGQALIQRLQLESRILNYYELLVDIGVKKLSDAERSRLVKEAIVLLSRIEDCNSFSYTAQLCYHSLYVVIYREGKNFVYAKEHYKIIIDLFEKERSLLKEYYKQYISAVNNFLNSCFINKDFEQAYERIQAFSTMQHKDTTVNRKLREVLLYAWQNYYLNKFDFSKAVEWYLKLEKFIEKNDKNIDIDLRRRFIIHYNGVVSYFLLAILHTPEKQKRTELLDQALNIIGVKINRDPEFNVDLGDTVLKMRILESVIWSELDKYNDHSMSKVILTRERSKLSKNFKRKHKILRLLYRYFSNNKLKYLEKIQKESSLNEWMEELYLWIDRKLSSV